MLDFKKRDKEATQLHAQKQQEKKTVLRGKIKPKQNHILFKQNIQTGEVEVVQKNVEKYNLHWFDALRGTYKSKYGRVKYEEGFRYCTAMNEENALKRFEKMIKEGLTFKS